MTAQTTGMGAGWVNLAKRGERASACNFSPPGRVIRGMQTFLKVVRLVVAALVAIKLLPLTFVLGVVLAVAVLALLAVGVSVIAALLVAAAILLMVLSPIWIPVLIIVGIVALIKRANRRT